MVALGVDNPVLLNLVFYVVVLAGLGAAWVMPKEEFPQVRTDRVVVVVPWPGASPADLEDRVVRSMEDAIEQVEGVEHIYADATEGRALLTLEFVRGTDVDAARDEVQRAVDGVDDLPEDALAARVSVARLRIPLLHVALVGDTRRIDVAEQIADELLAFPGVKEVDIQGADVRQLRVELHDRKAQALGVGPAQLVQALAAAGMGAPAGSLTLGEEGVLVRTMRGVVHPEDLAAVPLRVQGHTHLTVGDVARIHEVWEAPSVTIRTNGLPAIDLLVQRQDDADALRVVPTLAAWVQQRSAELPVGLTLVPYDDSARLVKDRLNILGSNGGVGIGLVALVLVVFIGLRNALLVVWGMPVAYLGAVAAMYAGGTTINVVSTFGLLLVTGIIVDDAIVIVENVQRHLEMGKGRVDAALDGASEVVGAVFAASLTTCLAFAPLLMLEGTVGRVMRIIPTVVILSLIASLFEAFVVLPGHLAHHAREHDAQQENLPTRLLKRAYAPVLEALTHRRARWPALLGLALVLLGSLSLAAVMKKSLTTPGNPVFAFIDVDLPASTDVEVTRSLVRDLERFTAEEAADLTLYAAGRVGEQVSPQGLPIWGARFGQLKLGFHNTPEVLAQVPAFLDKVRAELASRPEVTDFAITTLTGGPPAGKPVDVRVRGRDAQEVLAASEALVAHLATRPAVSDIRSDHAPGGEAFEVQVDAGRAARFGLREGQVAQRVRASLDGLVGVELSVDERTTEVRVASAEPDTLAALADLSISLPDGRSVRLRQVADVVRTRTVERIGRVDGQRAVRVTAEVDAALSSSTEEKEALDAAFVTIGATWPGVSPFFGGELADSEASFAQLPIAALMAVALIYAVLAVQFRSYVQPLLILTAIPLGMSGVLLGLFLFGMDLSLIAMIGAVGLVGIVVNDSLVLVDFINRSRAEGRTPRDAVIEASLVRLRPILITTVTTVLGLLPLALGVAGAEPLLAPMAVSISVGLMFATALTLVVVPVSYLVLEDATVWVGRRLGTLRHDGP